MKNVISKFTNWIKGKMRSTAKKEHEEHQKVLKPLLTHLKKDEKKLKSKKKAKK